MGWTVDVKNSVSYADMTEETSALDYKILWQMNQPAKVQVLVNDDSGAKTQTYGSTYIGTGTLLLEQPTNTEIFRGRIIGAASDVAAGTLTLKAEDWLSQLNDRLVIYDTREILDPNDTNSVRQTAAQPYLNAGVRCNAFYELGLDSSLTMPYDVLGNWTNDDYNGLKLCFPLTHAGSQTDLVKAYDETVEHIFGANIATDTGDESDTWVDDSNCHYVRVTDDAELAWFNIFYAMKSLTAASSKVASYDGMRVTITYETTDNCDAVFIGYNTAADGSGNAYYLDTLPVTDDPAKTTVKFPQDAVTRLDTDSAWSIQVQVINNTLTENAGIKIYYIDVEIDYTVTSPLTTKYTVDDTINVNNDYNRLDIDDQLMVTNGAIDWWDFYITNKLTVYMADLVTTYDELYAIDASDDVTASTNYVGRHYHRMTPLDILRDFAQIDGTDFWLNPWDGDSLDLVWNNTYATAGAPNWTDSSVLTWLTPSQNLLDVVNEWFVEGYTHAEYKVTGSDSDAGSITAYGRRSGLFNNPDIANSADADDEADMRVERTHDLPFHLGCLMDGYNTTALGTVIEVDSTKLGLTDAYYIVTRKEYDSRTAETTFHLTPREGTSYTLNPEKHLDNLMSNIAHRIKALEIGLERGSRYTESWS